MNRQQALKQLRIMRDWHEDNGDGPNADYDAICAGIAALETQEYYEKLITALEQEHKRLIGMQKHQANIATYAHDRDVSLGQAEKELRVDTDTISRQQAIDALNEYFVRIGKLKRRGLNKGEKAISLDTVGAINSLPPAQPEIIHCKDCRHSEDHKLFGDRFCNYGDRVVVVPDLHYCGYAERRTDG